jgi:hypothetical protein
MSFMFEVHYRPPADPEREIEIAKRLDPFGGHLTYREEPDLPGIGSICLTYEFGDYAVAERAAESLRSQGEHIEGPADYGG